ncbi:hypothetical protein ACHAXM_005622 [Skeletonema potamos]
MKFVILKLSAAAFAMLATASGVYATEEEPSNSYPSQSLRGLFLKEEETWWGGGGNNLGTCTSNCQRPMGGCVMNQCRTNCQCAMGGCQMNGCRDNCQCAMGSCQMTSCTQNCQCAMGNCQRDEDEGLDEAVAFTEA